MIPRTFLSSRCAQIPPNELVLAPMTATGFDRIGFSASGRETQSNAVLELAGDRPVELGRRHEDGVSRGDLRLEPLDLVRLEVVEVLVVGRHLRETLVDELDALGELLRREAGSRLSDPARRLPEMPRIRID